MGLSPRVIFIVEAVVVIGALSAMIIGLTFGLRVDALENGGSPDPMPGPCGAPGVPDCPESGIFMDKQEQMAFAALNSMGAH